MSSRLPIILFFQEIRLPYSSVKSTVSGKGMRATSWNTLKFKMKNHICASYFYYLSGETEIP